MNLLIYYIFILSVHVHGQQEYTTTQKIAIEPSASVMITRNGFLYRNLVKAKELAVLRTKLTHKNVYIEPTKDTVFFLNNMRTVDAVLPVNVQTMDQAGTVSTKGSNGFITIYGSWAYSVDSKTYNNTFFSSPAKWSSVLRTKTGRKPDNTLFLEKPECSAVLETSRITFVAIDSAKVPKETQDSAVAQLFNNVQETLANSFCQFAETYLTRETLSFPYQMPISFYPPAFIDYHMTNDPITDDLDFSYLLFLKGTLSVANDTHIPFAPTQLAPVERNVIEMIVHTWSAHIFMSQFYLWHKVGLLNFEINDFGGLPTKLAIRPFCAESEACVGSVFGIMKFGAFVSGVLETLQPPTVDFTKNEAIFRGTFRLSFTLRNRPADTMFDQFATLNFNVTRATVTPRLSRRKILTTLDDIRLDVNSDPPLKDMKKVDLLKKIVTSIVKDAYDNFIGTTGGVPVPLTDFYDIFPLRFSILNNTLRMYSNVVAYT